MQQIKLDRGQFDRLAVLANNSSRRIKFNIANLYYVGDLVVGFALFRGLSSPQNCADARDQFAGIEWFWKIIVGADFKPYNSVDVFPTRCEQQNWNPRSISYPSQYVKAVHPGQHYVEHD